MTAGTPASSRRDAGCSTTATGSSAAQAIDASLTREERLEILRGMMLTRATDNRLKTFFTGGEIRYGARVVSGQGIPIARPGSDLRRRRSGCAAARRSADADGAWHGDVIGPVIRDLGVALAMRPEPDTVRMVLNAQMGKAGAPLDGKDLHIGDFDWGILPPAAPLTTATLTIAGHGDGVRARRIGPRRGLVHRRRRVVARRMARGDQPVRRAPAAGDLLPREQPDGAVDAGRRSVGGARVRRQGRRVRHSRRHGRRHRSRRDCRGVHVGRRARARRSRADADRNRRDADVRPRASRRHAVSRPRSAAVAGTTRRSPSRATRIASCTSTGRARDPIATYAATARSAGHHRTAAISIASSAKPRRWSKTQARAVIDAPWPEPAQTRASACSRTRRRACTSRCSIRDPAARCDGREDRLRTARGRATAPAVRSEGDDVPRSGDARRRRRAAADPRVFVYGEDVGGNYGNAFLLLRPLLKEFGDRIINSPLAEGAVLGVCVGAALAGQRPIGEIQFNDFVATGFNQLVNNAAKIRYRWGGSVPMVVRMPWGGLRHAGPVPLAEHRAVVLSHGRPEDRRAVDAARRARADGVGRRRSRSGAVLRAHRALSRSAHQAGAVRRGAGADAARPGGAAAQPAITWRSSRTARSSTWRCASPRRWRRDGIEASVLDLRSLVPLDRDAVLGLARRCHRVLIVHEDSRTGGIGESLAAIIQEEAFECARRAGPHRRRARHAGAVLAAARGVLPAERSADRAGRAPPRALLRRRDPVVHGFSRGQG